MEEHGQGGEPHSRPLFSYFLSVRYFSTLMLFGVLTWVWPTYLSWSLKDTYGLSASALTFVIFVVLAPYVYYLTGRIFRDFNRIFSFDSSNGFSEKGERVRYLFSQKAAFERYKQNVFQIVYSPREKYLTIGVAFGVILPLVLMQDYRPEILSSIVSDLLRLQVSVSLDIIQYFYFQIYWATIYSLLLSILWMIIAVLRALWSLKKEREHLHITEFIRELQKLLHSSEDTELSGSNIGLLDLSFRRFKAGLSPIVNFIFSSSLKIAFVGSMCSIPALVHFLVTREIVIMWYALCAFTGLLSIVIFVIGQYGVWQIWASSKEDALHILDYSCARKTQRWLRRVTASSSKKRKDTRELSLLREVIEDLYEMTPITYTSHSIFKLTAANFLSFGPLILEQLLFLFVLS